MTDKIEKAEKIVKQFLMLRQNVLYAYWELLDLPSYIGSVKQPEGIRFFCQLLIDYTSLGHFCAYETFLKNKKLKRIQFEKKYDALLRTTDNILQFNDQCDAMSPLLSKDASTSLLSNLGEVLASRLELEDWFLEQV